MDDHNALFDSIIDDFKTTLIIIDSYRAETQAPFNLWNITHARERLIDGIIYDIAEYAKTLNDEECLNEYSQKGYDGQVVPILGNTLQIIAAYLNNSIQKEELLTFYEQLKLNGRRFILEMRTDWVLIIEKAFYTPSSWEKDDPMPVISNPAKVEKQYQTLLRMKLKYINLS